jgi:two-component system, chemotaxis family, sensor kinase CheA
VILQSVLKERMEDSEDLELKKIIAQLSKITKEVQDVSMQLRMVPVKPVFQKMQRIVRDTAELLKKDINFRMVGEDVEIDKTVLDMIGDPLTHLTRNSVDHGIEDFEAREASGKGKTGQIELRAAQESGRLILSITDDGKGLDTDRLYHKAVEKGIVKAGTTLSIEEIQKLIFHAGFSTKEQVTELSGRGVGMDVVRSNIEALGGEIQILSEKGKGTCIKVFLPLSLAIIDAIVVKANQSRYVIPLSHIQELVQLSTDMLHDASGIGDVLMLRGDNIKTYSLRHLLGLNDTDYDYKDAAIIVIRTSDDAFAVVVDEVVSRQQVVVKKLGDEVCYLAGFSGSTILGDGLPALILEMQELIKMAAKKGNTRKHIQFVSTSNQKAVA